MALSDEDLLDFDENRLDDYDRGAAEQALRKYGDAFQFQLVAARHIEGWAESQEETPMSTDPKTVEGIVWALREVAAHLRQGDYIPGGVLYDETVGD